jgi:hypothetical protein
VGNGPSVTAVRLCRRCSNDETPMIMPSLRSAFICAYGPPADTDKLMRLPVQTALFEKPPITPTTTT